MKQRPKCFRRRVSLGTWLEPVKPREWERQASGEGRLAALGHTPVCFSKAPLKISLFKDPTSSSADCANAGLFLSHVVGPLVFFTEHPRFALKTTWKRNGIPSSQAPTPTPLPPWGMCTWGMTPCGCGGVRVYNHAGIYQMSSLTLWVGVASQSGRSFSAYTNSLCIQLTNRAPGGRNSPPSVAPLYRRRWTSLNELPSGGWPGPDPCETATG